VFTVFEDPAANIAGRGFAISMLNGQQNRVGPLRLGRFEHRRILLRPDRWREIRGHAGRCLPARLDRR
jgi:hypothetical protein